MDLRTLFALALVFIEVVTELVMLVTDAPVVEILLLLLLTTWLALEYTKTSLVGLSSLNLKKKNTYCNSVM